MSERKFEYDVAFSFLAEDEPVANQINALIKGRLKTFVYSERQSELAGTDGEKTFNEVFGFESRVVVVLYREGWGERGWTQIEETAIRNRAFEEGYEFTLFIPLDPNPTTPKWLPRTQLWFGLGRYGIEGAAGAIEARVQQTGGVVHETSPLEEAALLAEEAERRKRERQLLGSIEGVTSAAEEIKRLFDQVKLISEELSKRSIKTDCARKDDECVAYSNGISLVFVWIYHYRNSLDGSGLQVRLSRGVERLGGHYRAGEKPTSLQKWTFNFAFDIEGHPGWRDAANRHSFYTSNQLADFAFKGFLKQVGHEII